VSLKDVVLALEKEVMDLQVRMQAHEYEVYPSIPEVDPTATCHICGKRDFKDNLADASWMTPAGEKGHLLVNADMQSMAQKIMDTYNTKHAHPSCAKIHRSDDGKGWVKDCDCKGKK